MSAITGVEFSTLESRIKSSATKWSRCERKVLTIDGNWSRQPATARMLLSTEWREMPELRRLPRVRHKERTNTSSAAGPNKTFCLWRQSIQNLSVGGWLVQHLVDASNTFIDWLTEIARVIDIYELRQKSVNAREWFKQPPNNLFEFLVRVSLLWRVFNRGWTCSFVWRLLGSAANGQAWNTNHERD